ncbi:hypothetical protein EDD16DRAFT_1430880, partial [Pisolithus croceorrhizus]
HTSRRLCKWARAYIKDRSNLPVRQKSLRVSLVDDEEVAQELTFHLWHIGKYACAKDLVDYLKVPENQERLGTSKSISLRTAHRWLKKMGWGWKKELKGQYVDGHEHSDVVAYCQDIFLP